MPNKLIYSATNCLQMFDPGLTRDARFNSKDFIDFSFPETILPWEQNVGYCQPWQLNDSIQLQLQTNVGPVNFIIKDCLTDSEIDTIAFTQKQESVNEPGLFIYEVIVPLAGYAAGCYYVELDFGGGIFIIRSGEQNFQTKHDDTLLFEYKHYEEREDLIFETGFFPSFRVHGTLKFDRAVSKKTVYEDQPLNASKLRAQKYRKWNLVVGGSLGIPDPQADMIAGMIECSDYRIEGKNFTVMEGSDMEPNGVDDYPMRAWSVELRERYTRGARVYENDEPINAVVTAMVTVSKKGFGSSAGSETVVIDVE